MKVQYCEVKRGKDATTIIMYDQEQYMRAIARGVMSERRRKEREARARRRNRIRETIGAFVALLGFFILTCGAGGSEEIAQIVALCAVGLALLALGGWMGHAFYGQEVDAEWLRRLRERGEVQ